MRAADAAMRTLRDHGVRTIFTLSGNQVMSLFDAMIAVEIEPVHVRHEAAAVYMAEGFAQVSGQCGVALLTAGPGFANGLAALYAARASETPLLVLAGDAPLAQAGQGAFQDVDQCAAAAPFAKASMKVKDPAQLGEAVADAIALALSGRPGPVHLAVPADLLSTNVDAERAVVAPRPPQAEPLDETAARDIAGELAGADRPLVVVGPRLCRHPFRDALEELADALAAPVLRMEYARGLDDPSLGAAGEILPQADLLLLFGKAPDFALGFARPPAVAADAGILQVDPDPQILDRTMRVLGNRYIAQYPAEPAASIASIREAAARLRRPRRESWMDEVADALACREMEPPPPAPAMEGVAPLDVCAAAQAVLDASANAVLVCDGGEFGQWAKGFLSAPRRIVNGPSGAIGGAIPYAIGARLADPDALVVAMSGDGSVGFHIAEFDTAIRANAPFVAVIGNDGRWYAEQLIQLRDYGADRLIGTDLLPTRYDRVAEAFGAWGASVESAAELSEALEQASRAGRPACVNVRLAGLPAPVFRRSEM